MSSTSTVRVPFDIEATFTAKGLATRRRIIEGAAAEIRENGVIEVTLDDVRQRTGTSKSQLFHYFPEGKEQLLLAVARYEADRVLSYQAEFFERLDSWASWASWRDTVVAHYRDQGQQCPLSMVIGHLGRTTPGAQAVTSELFGRWQEELAAGIRQMQDGGEIAADLDVERATAALIASIQGGVLIMLATGEVAALEAAIDVAIEHLHSAPRG
jgi:AcrR family transcriptional regulator